MLLIDEEIAAFVVGLLDDDEYRVFDGHFDTSFRRYSPGRIIEAAVLERAMADPQFNSLDWMAGVSSEKILTSNHTVSRMQLVALERGVDRPGSPRRRSTPAHPHGARRRK